MERPKNIAVLGSTGSIGRQSLEVARQFPEQLRVVSLAAGSNVRLLTEQVREFRPQIVSVGEESSALELARNLRGFGDINVVFGSHGLISAAVLPEVDTVVTAVSGAIGLVPTLEAIRQGKDIALANKETLVAAGELVMGLARSKGTAILPVDSEHSAVFQSLQGSRREDLKKIILTASGGPFRGWDSTKLAGVTPEMALRHPNWSMGRKITIDSATMMNKGLEVIEAHWLFEVPYSGIEVVVHPQSIIHSMVEYNDGAIIAQLGVPDMKVPIQYALSHPARWSAPWPVLDWTKLGLLTFEKPNPDAFKCLQYAFDAGQTGGTLPAVMNAANEEAVGLFLEKTINFPEIAELVARVMNKHNIVYQLTLEEILEADLWARQEARNQISNLARK